MIARISTHLSCSETELWKKIEKPKSLEFVAAPVLKFIPVGTDDFDDPWEINRDYNLKLYLFGLIPLGSHNIRLLKADKRRNIIESREKGLLTRVWNHTITFHEVGDRKVHYTDKIEIKAGVLTPVIYVFAQLFYRHRQRRWKRLLKESE
ncbi:MAG: hypothetical protein ACQETF_11215 [Bacteroidota bacterium]